MFYVEREPPEAWAYSTSLNSSIEGPDTLGRLWIGGLYIRTDDPEGIFAWWLTFMEKT